MVWDKGSAAPAVEPSARAENPLCFPCPESRGRPQRRARAGERRRGPSGTLRATAHCPGVPNTVRDCCFFQ